MSHRPDLTVSFDEREMAPGRAWPVQLRVDCSRATRFDGIDVALHAREVAYGLAGSGTFEVKRKVRTHERAVLAHVGAGTMPAGAWDHTLSLPLPPDLPLRERTALTLVEHVLDVRLRVAGEPERRQRLLIGPARSAIALVAPHLELWLEAVNHMRSAGVSAMRFHPKRAEASFEVGGVDARVRRRIDRTLGPCFQARLQWPSVGLRLHVTERFESDPPAPPSRIDPELQERFWIAARNARQLAHFFDADLGHALAAFDRAAMDDDGATCWQRDPEPNVHTTERFLYRTYELSKQMYRALRAVLPPPSLRNALGPYRAFAERAGAQLHVGNLSLSAWRPGGPEQPVEVALAHRFDPEPRDSCLWTTVPPDADRAAWLRVLAAACRTETVSEPHRIGIVVPLAVDPSSTLPAARAFAGAVHHLLGHSGANPYR